jgi:DNA-binding transcriptional LysR family regulator
MASRPQGLPSRFVAGDASMLLKLAIEGIGIVRLGEIAVAGAIRRRLLRPLLEDFQVSESHPLWAMLPAGNARRRSFSIF